MLLGTFAIHNNKSMKRKNFSEGFTLIELLIVIAIIGTLSSVVLANLSSARNKSINAGIRSSFAQLRSEGNIYFNDNGSFGNAGNLCTTAGSIFTHPRFAQILASAQNAPGTPSPVCRNTATAWAVSIQLKQPESGNAFLCADSAGALKSHPTVLGSGVTVCP